MKLNFVTQRLLHAEALIRVAKKEKVHTKTAHNDAAFVLVTRKKLFCRLCNLKEIARNLYVIHMEKIDLLKRHCKAVKGSNEKRSFLQQYYLLMKTLETMNLS